MMRPIGVLSKNDIGARSPLFKMDVCSNVAERSVPSASANAHISTQIPVATTHPNTLRRYDDSGKERGTDQLALQAQGDAGPPWAANVLT